MLDASKRTSFVFGSSRGIGAAVARRLHADGWHVVIHGRRASSALSRLSDEVGCGFITFDVSDRELTREAVKRAIEQFGVPRSVVYCCGINRVTPFESMDQDELRAVMDVNFMGAVYVFQVLMPALKDSGEGRVVLVTSIRGFDSTSSERIPIYSASKAAMSNLTVTLAKRYAPEVRVNGVAPGFTVTDMTDTWNERVWEQAQSALLGRPADPSEIAGAVSFLVSDDAAFITGQTITVDGGYSAAGK